jgi:hypothetical protein
MRRRDQREHTAALAAIKIEGTGTMELKFHNKTEAVNVLLRSIGAIIERHEHDHTIFPGLGERLNRARERRLALDHRAPVNGLEGLPEQDHRVLIEKGNTENT